MNRRIPLFLLFSFLVLMWVGPLIAQNDSLIVQSGFGDPGSSGNLVFIDLRNHVSVGKMQFTLNYNSTVLTATDVVSTSRSGSMSIFNWSEPVPGQLTVFVWDLEGDTIDPGSGSIVNVSFDVSPTAHYSSVPVTLSGVIVYNADGGIIPTSAINGTFTITEPDIQLSATSHVYGQVVVGESATWSVNITNVGTKTLIMNYITSSSGEFAVQAMSYPDTLFTGDLLTVQFTFAPNSAGSKSSNIYIFSDDPDESVATIVLSGTGIAPDISLSAGSHNFGNVIGYSTATWVFTISNMASTANLTVSSIVSNHPNYKISNPSFPRLIPIDGNLDVTVTFTPSQLGLISGMLTISSNDPDEASLTVSLSGTGYYPAAAIIVDGGQGQEDSQGNPVPISLENEMAVGLVQFTLSYPHTLLTITEMSITGRVSSLSYFDWDEISPGIIDVLIAGTTGSIIQPGTGPIIESIFDVDPGAMPGNAPLVLSDVVFADKSSNHIPSLKTDGNFTILPAPDIDVSEEMIAFGDVLVGDSLGLVVQIYNLGTAQLTVDSLAVTSAQFGCLFPTFPQVIDAGDSLSGVLFFRPTGLGQTSGTAVIFSDDPNEGQKAVNLQGRGVQPDIEISPLSYDLGQVWVTDTSTVVILVRNVGTADLMISSIVASPIQYEVSSDPLPAAVAPGHSFAVTVDFHPTSVGQVPGSLFVQTDDPNEGTVIVSLSGSGIDPEIGFSATSHAFGDVLLGESGDWLLTIRNQGLTDLVVDSARSTHGDFGLAGFSLPRTLSAGDSALALIRFTPSSVGTRTATLRIYSNDRDESPTLLQMSGKGVVPDIQLSSTTHDFGNVVVNHSSDWPLKIYNLNIGLLIVSGVTTNNSDFFVANPDFPDTVVLGDSLVLAVRFVPSKTGPISGILKVMSNDPDESQLSISVGGNGVVPDIALPVLNHYFGFGVLCDTVSWTLNVFNRGTADLTIDRIYADTSDYQALDPIFPQSVPPGETLDVIIGFIPSQLGSIIGHLFILTDDPDEDSVNVILRGFGYAIDVAAPDTSAMPAQTISVPVFVQEITGLDIYSWAMSLSFDGGLLTAVRAISTRSISQAWGSPTYSIRPGAIDIEMSGVVPLSGGGPLVFITFEVGSFPGAGDSSVLHIDAFRFNDGAPAARPADGFFHVNRQPHFDAISDQTAHEGLFFSFVVTAVDPDRDPLTFSASNLPAGAAFNPETHRFSWTPGFGTAGVYPGVRFYVSDGQFTDTTDVTVTVESSIRVAVPDTTRPANVSFSLPLLLLDPVTTADSIYSVDLTLTYDPEVLTALGATKDGTLTNGWGPQAHRVTSGQITFGIIGFEPLNGSGVLVYINFAVSARVQPGDSSALVLTEFQFNDGDPAAYPLPGVLTIPLYSISGEALYYMQHSPGLPIDSVLVEVIGSASRVDFSDDDGSYYFADLVGGLGYAIRPAKDGDRRSAIASYDASLITRYVVGMESLADHQQLAADVTGNGKVSAFDASEVLKFRVGLISRFSIGKDWMFIPEQRDYPVLDADHAGQDYTGILYGDVSGDWGVTGSGKALVDGDWLDVPQVQGTPGSIVRLPIVLGAYRDVMAMDIDMAVDPDFIRVLDVARTPLTSDYLLEYNVAGDMIRIAMAGTTPLMSAGEIVVVNCLLSPQARIGDSRPVELQIRLNETVLPPVTGMVKATEALPAAFDLQQNYPNPFNPTTTITYSIPVESERLKVKGKSSFNLEPSTLNITLKVYNVLGQEVRVLVDQVQEPGYYSVTWDGTDAFGHEAASGVYFYRLDAGDYHSTKRMMLMK